MSEFAKDKDVPIKNVGNMSDLISRQAALDIVFDFAETPDKMYQQIRELPTIDPVKHGEWVYKGPRGRFPICECSVCGNAENADWAILGDNVNYCPNCGARMDGGEDDG